MGILLLLQIQTAILCDSLIVPDPCCYDTVLECAYDEGDAEWCFEFYLEDKE